MFGKVPGYRWVLLPPYREREVPQSPLVLLLGERGVLAVLSPPDSDVLPDGRTVWNSRPLLLDHDGLQLSEPPRLAGRQALPCHRQSQQHRSQMVPLIGLPRNDGTHG